MAKYGLSSDTIPDWLVKLMPGKYTITEIQNISGVHRDTIYTRLEALSVDKEWVKIKNRWKNQYNWKGASHYWAQMYQEKQVRLSKEKDCYGTSA